MDLIRGVDDRALVVPSAKAVGIPSRDHPDEVGDAAARGQDAAPSIR
jgi:hypothetical protein